MTLPNIQLASTFRRNIFLTVKEALNNAVKHSGASAVWLRASFEDAQLSVVIEDDGRGLPVTNSSGHISPLLGTPSSEASRFRGGNGLRNMRKRIEEIGGELVTGSNPNGGTRITVAVKV